MMVQREIEYELTAADQLEAYWGYFKSRRILWWAGWGFMILYATAGAVVWMGEADSIAGFAFIYGLLVIVGIPVLVRVRIHRAWKRQWRGKVISLNVMAEGVKTTTAQAMSERKWEGYTAYLETRRLFLLYVQPRICQIVPKRALGGEEEVGAFGDLLAEKIGKVRSGWFF